jgi:flavodoxin
MNGIEIIEYSAASIAVRGDTKPHKETLKRMGAKYNPSLNDPETEEKFCGWIISKKKRDIVEQWIETGEADLPPLAVPVVRGGKSTGSSTELAEVLKAMKALEKRFEKQEKMLANLAEMIGIEVEEGCPGEDESSDEDFVPKRKLLK